MSSCCAPTCCSPAVPDRLPVAVIGAGPVGLAASAHLLARGLESVILEAGSEVGTLARAWGHVRMFSPWRYDTDKAAVAMLKAAGWRAPDADAFPTGTDLVEGYLKPLAGLPEIAAGLRLNARVTAVARSGGGRAEEFVDFFLGRWSVQFEDAVGQRRIQHRRADGMPVQATF